MTKIEIDENDKSFKVNGVNISDQILPKISIEKDHGLFPIVTVSYIANYLVYTPKRVTFKKDDGS